MVVIFCCLVQAIYYLSVRFGVRQSATVHMPNPLCPIVKSILHMRLIYLILVIGLSACSLTIQRDRSKNNDRDSIFYNQIKDSGEFTLFSEFLLKYPDSKYFNQALKAYFEEREKYYDKNGWPIIDCFRNCANIKIRPNQEIIFEYEKIEFTDLKDSLLTLLINEDYSEFKPEKKEVEDLNGVIQEISKGHVELTYVKDSCQNLQEVLIEISHSYNEYKNHLSRNWYHEDFEYLDKFKREHLDSMFCYRLFIYEFDKEYLPPPPPPCSEAEVLNLVEDEVNIENIKLQGTTR